MRLHKLWLFSAILLSVSTFTSADIVFKSERNDANALYVMNDDGSEVRQLTNGLLEDWRPIWSPDGRYIAFTRDLNSAQPGLPQQIDLFVMHADGSHQQNLTQSLDMCSGNMTWSPDGRYLAFSIDRNRTLDIAVLDIANGTVRYLTNNPAGRDGSTAPCWSPDGQYIVYEQTKNARGRTIYKMKANGRNATQLLPGDGQTMRGFPRWSPDGEKILYSEAVFHIGQGVLKRIANRLVVMRKDGSNARALTIPKTWVTFSACWAADGTQILFSAMENGLKNPNGNFDIYRYELASRAITNLTNHPANDYSPDWTPRRLSVSPGGKLTTQWARIKGEK